MKQINKILPVIAIALIANSCGIFNKPTRITASAAEASTTESAPASQGVNKSANSETRASFPNMEKQIAGEWTIISVYNKKITSQELPFLIFDIKTNKVFGNNGCNVINGNFEISNTEKELKLTNLVTSLMSCPDYKTESTIMRAIGEVTGYNLVTIKGVIHLNLLDYRGATILQLKRHNLNEINGAWSVKIIDGKAINDKNVRLVIDVQELRLHGNSGCNIINGQIALDPRKDFAIQFSQITSTRKACPNSNVEMALMVALEEVESYKKVNTNEIVFYNYKKEPTLTLKRLKLKK